MKEWELMDALSDVDEKHVRSIEVFTKTGPTWRVIMKKTTKFALTAAAVVLVLGVIFGAWWLQTYYGVGPGSEGDKEPLHILVDLEQRGMVYGDMTAPIDNMMALLNYNLPESERIPYVVEYLPQAGTERTVALQRLGVEVMAGKGPDVYLISCPTIDNLMVEEDEKPTTLFRFPETAMNNGAFLPLDSYLQQAEFAEFDKFPQAVMNAGRTEQGQVILPMTYTVPITVFHKEDVSAPDGPITWTEQATSDDLILQTAAYWSGMGSANSVRLGSIFGKMADYDSGTILLSEEELGETLTAMTSMVGKRFRHEFSTENIPVHYQTMLGPFFQRDTSFVEYTGQKGDFAEKDPLTMFPVYNSEGGVTATITCWAAVDAHSKRPKDAFRVLDYLFSLKMQQANTSGAAEIIWRVAACDGMPVHEEILSFDAPFSFMKIRLTDENYEELCRLRSTITNAKFNSQLDAELETVFDKLVYYSKAETDEEIRAAVAEVVPGLYDRMKKMVAES